jgi:hypothetical protein
VPPTNEGTGWADYTLTGFSAFDEDDEVAFHFVFTSANPGTENVFLIAGDGDTCPTCGGGGQSVVTPEPASMLLLGTGLLAVAHARRKKIS